MYYQNNVNQLNLKEILMQVQTSLYTDSQAKLFRTALREVGNTSIQDDAFVSSEVMKATLDKISELDFTPHGYKLEKEYGWSLEKINQAMQFYKEWLALQVHYEDLSFAPSELIDEFWHVHILDTRKYLADCQKIKGELIHHYPYFGLTEQENEIVLEQGFELTKKLYQHHFSRSDLGFHSEAAASCGCRSGNGSSCR